MTKPITIDFLFDFSREAHRHQQDKAGKPYFDHILRVVDNCRRLIAQAGLALTTEQAWVIIAVAILHDVVEDEEITGVGYARLEEMRVPGEVIERVRRLDKRFKTGSYQQNIQAIADEGDIVVIVVKWADILDNSSPARIASLPPEERSIVKRYTGAGATLEAAYKAYIERKGGI